MSSSHRRITADQQAPFVRWHLANKESVSTLAEKFGLHPGQIHLWVNQLLAQGRQEPDRSSGSTGASQPQAPHAQRLEA